MLSHDLVTELVPLPCLQALSDWFVVHDIYSFAKQKDRLLTYVLKSKAEYAIIPLADIIGLGKEGHINTPGTVGSPNWEWHMVDFKKAKEELERYRNLIMNR